MGGLFSYDGSFMEGIGKIVDLIWLNILTIIFCIPLVTIGASTAALYTVTLKMLKKEDAHLTRTFIEAFRNNFKKATIEWMIIVLVAGIICGDFYIINRSTEQIFIVINYGLLVISVIMFLIYTYVFPLQAYFENTVKMCFKNALILSISNIHYTIIIVFVHFLPVFLVSQNNLFLILVFLVGVSGTAYVNSFFFQKIFDKIEKINEKENSLAK